MNAKATMLTKITRVSTVFKMLVACSWNCTADFSAGGGPNIYLTIPSVTPANTVTAANNPTNLEED